MKASKRSVILIGILLGVTTNTLMQTIVATILPQVSKVLGDSHLYGWVFSGYLLMSTITIPLFSKLADLYGYKLFFTIGMAIFLVGSLLCGMADSFPFLVGSRLVQGVGAGVLGPVATALIATVYPSESRGKALSSLAAVQLLSNILGPIVGGVIATSLGWAYAFYLVIPFGIISLLIIQFAELPTNHKAATASLKNIDYWGAFLLGAGVALFIQTWTTFEKSGWNVSMIVMLAASVFFGIWFVFQEKKHPDPVLSPKIIRIRNVSLASISALFVGAINYGAISIFPLFAVVLFNSNSAKSSTFLLPLMIGLSIGIIISSRLSQKVSYKVLAQTGWLLSAFGLALTSLICFVELPNNLIYIFAFMIGGGIGILMPTFMLPAQNAVSDNEQATVGGIIQLSRNVGGAIGIPILTSILALTAQKGENTLQYGIAFLVLFLLTLIGFFVGRQFEGSAVKRRKEDRI
ncbi:MFS transporter [Priestia flexa]|uniref:MFS transporter n=1 Tax=Priestia flexa TaxID=86664 RepID=UPI003D2F25D7